MVGRGDEGKYGKLAQSLGIAEAVTFAGTQVDGLERYYRAADIFIMLSAFDTFGMVVLEAMAAGLPVIVSPNVGAKDLVEEGINGFILPTPQDADAAADRIVRLSDASNGNAMGAAAAADRCDARLGEVGGKDGASVSGSPFPEAWCIERKSRVTRLYGYLSHHRVVQHGGTYGRLSGIRFCVAAS